METGSIIADNINRSSVEVNNGGGVNIQPGAVFDMDGGTISHNIGIFGGGVYVRGGVFTMREGAVISNNRATQGGGVRVMPDAVFTMINGSISNNRGNLGGGVCTRGSFTMHAGNISSNTSNTEIVINSNGGAGVNIGSYTVSGTSRNGTFLMLGGTISNNSTQDQGGGVRINSNTTFTMNAGTISGNESALGGGIRLETNGRFIMHNGTISGNRAVGAGITVRGGGVFNEGSFEMHNGTISGNTSARDGGGLVNFTIAYFRMVNGVIHGDDSTVVADRNISESGSGAALWLSGTSSIAQYGTYGDDSFHSNGDFSTTNNTIRVTNGARE
jgi:hypothetical protein